MPPNNLDMALHEMGRPDEATAAFRQALALKPDLAAAHSNLILAMNYDDGVTQDEILTESRRWGAAHGAPGVDRPAADGRQRRLRIGYVSPDFRRHSVGHFIAPIIANHDRWSFEVYCYAEVATPDDQTARFQSLAQGWRSTVGLSDGAVAEQIRHDGIDILVDLAGHTAGNRLGVFAEQPAPVQLTWIGYPNTTGMAAMGYRFTDAVADPPGAADNEHTETLLRLEHGFLCFAPPDGGPDIAPAPSLKTGHVTFGSFNHLPKVNPGVVAVWAAILRRTPGSRLIIKSRTLADRSTRERYGALFAAEGVEPDRVELLSWIASSSGHLEAYGRVDIALDPFPYNGTTTTCEALWMGVPVVTLRGSRHAGRVGASLLTRLGLDELIADTVDGYIDIAATLDPERQRHGLRQRMADSTLCDAETMTRDVEAAYRRLVT